MSQMSPVILYATDNTIVEPSRGGSGIDEQARAAAAAAQTTADNAQTAADNAQTAADNAQTAADNAQTAADNAQTAADNAQTAADNAQARAELALDVAADAIQYTTETEEPIVINFHHLASGNGGESTLTLTVSSVWDPGGEELPVQTLENGKMKFDLINGTITFDPGTPRQKILYLYNLAS